MSRLSVCAWAALGQASVVSVEHACLKVSEVSASVDSRNSSKSYILQTLQNDEILFFQFRCNDQSPACSHCKRQCNRECVYQEPCNRRRAGKERRQRKENRDIFFTSDVLLPSTSRRSEKSVRGVWTES